MAAYHRKRSETEVPVSFATPSSTQTVRLGFYALQAFLDLIAMASGVLLGFLLRSGGQQVAGQPSSIPVMMLVFGVATFYLRGYSYVALFSARRGIARVLGALLVTLGVNLLLIFSLKQSEQWSRVVFFVGAGIAAGLLVAGRLAVAWLVSRLPAARFMRRLLIVDGAPVVAPDSFEPIDAQATGLSPDIHDPVMLHNFSRLVHNVDRVVVSCPPERREDWATYLKGVGCWGELLIPELASIGPVHHEAHLGLVGILVSTNALDLRNRAVKRLLDLLFAVPAIILLAPVLAVVALAVKLDSPGPVLFRQQRMGRGNQLFAVFKFRSMRVDVADSNGDRSTARDDDRITRVGRLIRTTSIDELPQLFNVLRGDMSLVGPRPHALGSMAGDQLFWNVDTRYWLRHAIKPGITGLAQVRGFRGATDHRNDLADRLHSDLEYVTAWSVGRDLAILCRTLLVIIHQKAY